jgi:hypothetical protein
MSTSKKPTPLVKLSNKPDNDSSFYAELDHDQHGQGCCSATAILICLVVALIIGGVSIMVFIKPLGSIPAVDVHLSKSGVSGNTALLGSDQTYQVHISDAEMTDLLQQQNIPNVSDISATITKDKVELRGTTTTTLRLPVYLAFVPKVKNSVISIEVRDVTVGGIRAIPLANEAIRNNISHAISNVIQDKFQGTIQAITLEDHQVTATLKPNQ